MTKAIYFDMDGTIADLYGVEGWLSMLRNSDPTPYAQAKPLVKLNTLARLLNSKQREGYTLGVISWLSKTGTQEYNNRVTQIKLKWLKEHLNSVKWDEIHIIEYGTPKQDIVKYPEGILFDDEYNNRCNWKGTAYDVDDIIGILKSI